MSKQELIERIEGLKNLFGNKAEFVEIDAVIELISKLDEPKPAKVPQFVADWYEENKDDFEGNLYRCAHNIPSTFDGAKLNEFERWFLSASTKSFQTLVNMHQFGYEVQGRKYVVTDGNHLYFKNYQEDIEIIILVDEQPGTMEYVKKFDTKEEAQKAADILGWKVQEVE